MFVSSIVVKLAELPGFARDSCGIIIHVLVAVFPQFNMSRGANFVSQLCPFTCRRNCIRVPNMFTIRPTVWHLSNMFEFVTPNRLQISLGARWVNYVSLFPFPDESVYVCQVWSRSVQGFGSFPRFINLLPPIPHAPRVSSG